MEQQFEGWLRNELQEHGEALVRIETSLKPVLGNGKAGHGDRIEKLEHDKAFMSGAMWVILGLLTFIGGGLAIHISFAAK